MTKSSLTLSAGSVPQAHSQSPLLAFVRSIHAAMKARAAEAELAALDDRALRDLGLTPSDIPRVARTGRDRRLSLGGCDR